MRNICVAEFGVHDCIRCYPLMTLSIVNEVFVQQSCHDAKCIICKTITINIIYIIL
jgi:hypothetical protein